MSEEFISDLDFPFTMLPTKIWEVGLSGNELIILTRILYRAGLKGACFESRASIAEACSMTERTVGTVFAELERLKIVQITRRRAEMKPNLIRINALSKWISKRKNFPTEDHPQEKISSPLRKKFPDPQEKISYGTRSPELDSIELDSSSMTTAETVIDHGSSTEIVAVEIQEPKQKTPTTADAWKVYAYGYEKRYKVAPLRNAKVNSQLKQFCERVGFADAPMILAFYLTQNDFWYVKQMHTLGIALTDAEKLTAAYRRGSMVTKREADYIDKISSRDSFYDKIFDLIDSKDAQQGGTE